MNKAIDRLVRLIKEDHDLRARLTPKDWEALDEVHRAYVQGVLDVNGASARLCELFGGATLARIVHPFKTGDGERKRIRDEATVHATLFWNATPKHRKYCGDMNDRNQYHGQGTAHRSDGTVAYEGEWKDGKHHGAGKAYLPDGTLWYEGEWQEGKYNGAGKLYYPEGTLGYEGGFRGNRYHGTGTRYYADGTLAYEGEYKEDKYHGAGKWYRGDGTLEYEGEWQEGQRHGTGKAYLPDGATLWYEGEWKDDAPCGAGRVHHPGGSLLGVFGSDAAPQCAMCLNAMPHGSETYAFAPCGHRCVCGDCVDATRGRRDKCFVCRQSADGLLRIY